MSLNTLRYAFLSLLLGAPTLAQGAAPAKPTIVMISTKTGGGPNLTPQVNSLVAKELKKAGTIVPNTKVTKATKKLKIKPKDMNTAASAKSIGAELAATHVLIIEGLAEPVPGRKGKPKMTYSASVSLVNVQSGEVTWTARYTLKGKKLDPATVRQMGAEVTQALNPPATPPPPETPPPPAPGAEQPPPAAPAPPPPAAEGGAQPASAAAAQEQPAPAPGPAGEATPAPATPPPEQPAASPAAEEHGGRRPGLELDVGGILLERSATISGGQTPPSDQGPPAGVALHLGFYPLSFGGTGKFVEGLGIFVDVGYMFISTSIKGSTAPPYKSSILQVNGGLAARMVFGDSVTSPDFTLKLGYSYMDFPLSPELVFPGVRYAGPTLGGQFTLPFVPQFALIVGGYYGLLLKTSGAAASEMGTFSSAYSFRVEGGFSIVLAPIEIKLIGRYEKVTSSFKGSPTTGGLSGYTLVNATLNDSYFGGMAMVGIQF